MGNKLSMLLVAALGTPALAQGEGTESTGGASAPSAGSLGVGMETTLRGSISGIDSAISANYDVGKFHVGGFFGFSDDEGDGGTNVNVGVRFYYHLHSSAYGDFGVGGALDLGIVGSEPGPPETEGREELYIVPGFQVRSFLSSNVALSFTGGLVVGVADADGIELAGQPTGTAGVHYYFY